MAITIKGIRLETVIVERDAANGQTTLKSATYSLLSSMDKVLAQQSVGGYNGMIINPSADTIRAMNTFITSYVKDLTTTLGLEES